MQSRGIELAQGGAWDHLAHGAAAAAAAAAGDPCPPAASRWFVFLACRFLTIVLLELFEQSLHETVRIDGCGLCPIFGEYDGIADDSLAAPGEPLLMLWLPIGCRRVE